MCQPVSQKKPFSQNCWCWAEKWQVWWPQGGDKASFLLHSLSHISSLCCPHPPGNKWSADICLAKPRENICVASFSLSQISTPCFGQWQTNFFIVGFELLVKTLWATYRLPVLPVSSVKSWAGQCPFQFCKISHSSSALVFEPPTLQNSAVIGVSVIKLFTGQCIIIKGIFVMCLLSACPISSVPCPCSVCVPVSACSVSISVLFVSCISRVLCLCHLNICERTRPLFPRRLKKQGQYYFKNQDCCTESGSCEKWILQGDKCHSVLTILTFHCPTSFLQGCTSYFLTL